MTGELIERLTDTNARLSSHLELEIDYEALLNEMFQMAQDLPLDTSSNSVKLLSRNIVLLLQKFPNKIYDFANNQLNRLELPHAIVLLIDLFETFPSNLTLLITFSVQQIYKALKKLASGLPNLIYLLHLVLQNATKADVDEKWQAKLGKLVSKQVADSENGVFVKKNYILCLKLLMVLGVSTNYELLMAALAQGSSQMKPDAVLAAQHTFQTTLLTTHAKVISQGLADALQEVRIASVELLSHVLFNLIPTGRFLALEYLAGLYPLPAANDWDDQYTFCLDGVTTRDAAGLEAAKLVVRRSKRNVTTGYDVEAAMQILIDMALIQLSIIEAFIFYLQLETFSNPDFMGQLLPQILDIVLGQFSSLNNVGNHVENSSWRRVQLHWAKVVDYCISESGSTCHEIVQQYLYAKFTGDGDLESTAATPQKKKKLLFKLKKSSTTSDTTVKAVKLDTNPYQAYICLHVVELLMPYGISFNSSTKEKEKPNSEATETTEPTEELAVEAASEFEPEDTGDLFLRNFLFRLLVNDNGYIRNYALETLLRYCQTNEAEVNQIILLLFKHTKQYPDKSDHTALSYALALLAIIKQTHYTVLLNTAIVKILSFCTQTLKHADTSTTTMVLGCWILLLSLVLFYPHLEYVRLGSLQFLVFWKGLLTLQFFQLSADDSTTKAEIVENLRVRVFSLVCLRNYLEVIDAAEHPELLKQIQFLLTKSYNYVSHLESNLEQGHITLLSAAAFNETDYNPNLLNGMAIFKRELSFEQEVVSLLFYCKKTVLGAFSKLVGQVKGDINSNMVIFLVRVFSDPKTFSRCAGTGDEKKKPTRKGLVNQVNPYLVVFNDDSNYFFGVTTKFNGNDRDGAGQVEATDMDMKAVGIRTLDPFATPGEANSWIDYFERFVWLLGFHSINCDPLDYFLRDQRYSAMHKYPPPLLTELVDVSIDLFAHVFSHLLEKIQFSLVEQMRTNVGGSGGSDPVRIRAVQVNVAVALALVVSQSPPRQYNEVAKVIEDMLATKIGLYQAPPIVLITANTVGRFCHSLSADVTAQIVSAYVQRIVSDLDPQIRGFAVLSLAEIFGKTQLHFREIYDVVMQLANDPNPVIQHYLMRALLIVLAANRQHGAVEASALAVVYERFFSAGSAVNSSLVWADLAGEYPSIGGASLVVKTLVTSAGPQIREWSPIDRHRLRGLVVSWAHGIGLATTPENLQVFIHLLRLFKELVIFDPSLLDEELDFFTDLLNLIIAKNIKLGLVSVLPTLLLRELLFPFTTLFDLFKAAYDCYSELIKISTADARAKLLTPDVVLMVWILMNIRPCRQLKEFVGFWLESTAATGGAFWVNTLVQLTRVSAKRLVKPFVDGAYLQKLLPLSQRVKKRQAAAVEFRDDEEVEGIVSAGDAEDAVEPITWEFKLFIYELMLRLLEVKRDDSAFIARLSAKLSDLVKMSFLGLTAPIVTIKLQGIHLLDQLLEIFGEMVDPMYPEVLILEQQQAQIISAIIPAFTLTYSNAQVIVNAILVSSKFINLPRIKFYSKQRILTTLIWLLEELAAGKFLRFTYLENMSEYGRKAIQLAILNCWAVLSLHRADDPELDAILAKYAPLLKGLWVVALREYSQLKYTTSHPQELAIYSNFWINFIQVLTKDTETDALDALLDGDAANFFFVLFSQCIESLVKNRDLSDSLATLDRLMSLDQLVLYLASEDAIFGEIIDLFDRLVLIDGPLLAVPSRVVDICSTMFYTYLRATTLELGFDDKMFELIRISMLPLFSTLPFLRNDYDPESPAHRVLLRRAESPEAVAVVKHTLARVIDMVKLLPAEVRTDMYACVLFVFAQVFDHGNSTLISLIIPHLKSIVDGASKELVDTFYQVVAPSVSLSSNEVSLITTYVVLVTAGNVDLSEEQSRQLAQGLLLLLRSESQPALAVQCIKSLIHHRPTPVLKYVLTDIINDLAVGEGKFPKLQLEILFLVNKTLAGTKLESLYSVLIPLLLSLHGKSSEIGDDYLHDKLKMLLTQNPASFKAVVTGSLSGDQKQLTEALIKASERDLNASHIELKTFG